MKPLLVAIGNMGDCEAQLAEARLLGSALATSIYLLHVEAPEPDFVGYEPGPQYERDAQAQTAMVHHAELHALRDELIGKGFDAHALVIQGNTVDKILEEAERLDAAMIILGAHAHGMLARFFSINAESQIVTRSTRPVLVVPTPFPTP